jgi:AraC family transcriptional regulator
MTWSDLYTSENQPDISQVLKFVKTPLWDDLAQHMLHTYNIQPKLSHSGCLMDKGCWKGWNVKYIKSGKSLCTLYPKEGYFMALINIGAKESGEAESMMPMLSEYTQNLYAQTQSGSTGKSLAFQVTSESILSDLKELIALRAAAR